MVNNPQITTAGNDPGYSDKTPEQLINDCRQRTESYRGTNTVAKGLDAINAFATNETFWAGAGPSEVEETSTDNQVLKTTFQQVDNSLQSGGQLFVRRGTLLDSISLPDETGQSQTGTEQFTGIIITANFALDKEGDPTRSIVYYQPADHAQKRTIKLFTREGQVSAQAGSPEFDVIETELAVQIGQGFKPLTSVSPPPKPLPQTPPPESRVRNIFLKS